MYALFAFIFQNSFLLRGIILFFLGLIIGSFLNVVIYRLPIMLLNEQKKLNLFYPPSHCTSCLKRVPFWANIPLFSYFLLNGKCHYCKAKISIIYPLVELFVAILFVVAGYITNDIVKLSGLLVFISFVVCLTVIDFKEFLLPDELTLPLLWCGLLYNLYGGISGNLVYSVIGAVIGYGLFWLIYHIFKMITHKDGMGYGDFKFFAAILAWVGYQALVPILLLSSMLGICYYVLAKISNKLIMTTDGQVPFGPFLGISGILLILASNYIDLKMFMFL